MASAGTQPEADDRNADNDSALRSTDANASTKSISSSILRYREENGRTYHAYKEGKYLGPNDEPESDRLDLQHNLFLLTYDGRLCICPVEKEKQLHRVLDVGTGTGIWAIDFADEHPETQVLGIDLSPIQPAFNPSNLTFEVDDLEEDWTFSYKFDFIYSRCMTGSFQDFSRFLDQSFEFLTPGGYIELADVVFPIRTDDDTIPPDSALMKWCNLMVEAGQKLGRPLNGANYYKQQLEAAGFTNIVEVQFKWPINRWPKDQKFKDLGMWTLANASPGLSGFSMALFTRVLGWSKEEVEVFLVGVRSEMHNMKVHGYWPIHVVYGQKPVTTEPHDEQKISDSKEAAESERLGKRQRLNFSGSSKPE